MIFPRHLKGKEHDTHCTDETNEAQGHKRTGLNSQEFLRNAPKTETSALSPQGSLGIVITSPSQAESQDGYPRDSEH